MLLLNDSSITSRFYLRGVSTHINLVLLLFLVSSLMKHRDEFYTNKDLGYILYAIKYENKKPVPDLGIEPRTSH